MAKTFRDTKGSNLTPAEVDANFRDSDAVEAALIESVAAKINSDKLAAANGVATLNAASKVLQTALNSEKIGGLTLAEFVADYTGYTDDAIDALNIGSIDGLGDALAGKQPTITPAGGWNANSGSVARSSFQPADWNEATGTKNLEDLANYFHGLITDLKTKGILID